MLVKLKDGRLGRIKNKDKKDGNLKVKVYLLTENLHYLYKKDQKQFEFHYGFDLIYRPKVIVNR